MTTLVQEIEKLPQGVYPDAFLRLVSFVMSHETVFQHEHYNDYDYVQTEHDPHDPGGTTRYGVDASTYPDVDIENLDFPGAVVLYFNHVWTPLRADELGADTALALCDAVINCGQARSIMWLQGCLGFDDADIDGRIGTETITAANKVDDYTLAHKLNARRLTYYTQEVRSSLQHLYLAGWKNRMADLGIFLSADPNTAVA